jgi:membrane associated rhomboid family serine protease
LSAELAQGMARAYVPNVTNRTVTLQQQIRRRQRERTAMARGSLRRTARTIVSALVVLWGMHIVSLFYPQILGLGIRPRVGNGLWGILTCPLLHASALHLAANCTALVPLLFLSLSYSEELTADAVGVTWLVGGGLVWVFGNSTYQGQPTVHIGASGLVFGLLGFLLFAGFWRRDIRAFLLTVLVFLFYGGTVGTLLHVIPGVSWSSHMFGFLSGVATARVTRRDPRRTRGGRQ